MRHFKRSYRNNLRTIALQYEKVKRLVTNLFRQLLLLN